MSIPATRADFKLYCLRKLGYEVLKMHVSDNQVEDRIDEAINYWQDFNSNAIERQFYKYTIQGQDVTNQYITLPNNIIGAISVYPPADAFNVTNIFNIRYQIALNDLYTLTSVSMAPYYMAFQHIALVEELLVGVKPVRFNKISNRLYIDADFNVWGAGSVLLIDCYQVIDPAVYPRMWGDRMLMRYATALIKRQQGENLQRYGNMQMPGGIYFNGIAIYEQAMAEITTIEKDMRDAYEVPPLPEIG